MKKGISLIVLVITIIVMIILAASVVITLSNTGVINRAGEAVNLTNQKQVQDLASLVWADAFMDNLRDEALTDAVKQKLKDQGIDEGWEIIVTNSGVTVNDKNNGNSGVTGTALGSLISADNYGDTVDYTVTVDGTTYNNWKIYYHNNEYIYIITSEPILNVALNKGVTVASLTADEMALYEKFRVGEWPKYALSDVVNGHTIPNNQATAQLIKEYAAFANTSVYGSNVVGSIGSPTIELLAAGWNAKGYTPTLSVSTKDYGYEVNNRMKESVTSDGFYVPTTYYYGLSSPSSDSDFRVIGMGEIYVQVEEYEEWVANIHPVVCLKASIPATAGTTTDFSLVK